MDRSLVFAVELGSESVYEPIFGCY